MPCQQIQFIQQFQRTMKVKHRNKASPKNAKHPYSCAHFQFHLNNQDPNTINAKLQLQQISSALDDYQPKQNYSHLKLFTMNNEAQKNQSWKSSTERKLFQSQNIQKKNAGKIRPSTNTTAQRQQYLKKPKNKKQTTNFCHNKQIKINLSFNNIQPSEQISEAKLNEINKIIKKSRPTTQKMDQFKKIINFSPSRASDNRIHSHSNLNIVQKLKSNFLSTSIYQFNQQTIQKQVKIKSSKKVHHFHNRVLSEPFTITNGFAKQKQNENFSNQDCNNQISSFLEYGSYTSCNLNLQTQQNVNRNCHKVRKGSKLRKFSNTASFKQDSQLKEDFEQLKKILKSQNENVLNGSLHRNLMTKYAKKQYKYYKNAAVKV